MNMRQATVAVIRDFDDWRAEARRLLAQGIPPGHVRWPASSPETDLFAAGEGGAPFAGDGTGGAGAPPAPEADAAVAGLPAARIPRSMLDLLQSAACFRCTDRWAFLYRVMWRWQHGEREVASAADDDGMRLHAMARAVRHEEHDMHAYVRFRERRVAPGDDGPRFVAWYEPAHDVLPQVGRHFAARMGNASWLIATPEATMAWNGEDLFIVDALPGREAHILAVDDGSEALWLTYYRSIFNPARLNARLMYQHVAQRFWKHLPEGRAVPSLVADAATGARRVGQLADVGRREGSVIAIDPARAMPKRGRD